MTQELINRMNAAIKRIGGVASILALPDQVREPIVNCPDYETRVKMLEMVADRMEGKR